MKPTFIPRYCAALTLTLALSACQTSREIRFRKTHDPSLPPTVILAWSEDTAHDYRVALFRDHTFSYDITEGGTKTLFSGHYTDTPRYHLPPISSHNPPPTRPFARPRHLPLPHQRDLRRLPDPNFPRRKQTHLPAKAAAILANALTRV